MVFISMTMVIMAALESLADEDRRQVGKDECLYERNQYFDQVNEDGQQDEKGGSAPSQGRIHGTEYKDQNNKAENDDVPRDHIGKKTYDQREGLCKDPHDLHRYHDWLDTEGYGRVGDMSPVMFVGAEEDHHEGNDAQDRSECYITGHIGRSGNQADEVIDQDKKEDGQQERHVFLVTGSQVGFTHFIPDKHDDGLHGILEAGGGCLYALSIFIFTGNLAHDQDQQQDGDQHLYGIASQGKIIYLNGCVRDGGGVDREDLPYPVNEGIQLVLLLVLLIHQLVAVVYDMPVFEVGRHEGGPSFCRGIEDDGQGDGDRLLIKCKEMKFMGVGDVLQDDLGRV